MKTKENKAITLVSLVVTIVILLILAGITISSLTNSSLLEKTKEANEKTQDMQEKEKIKLAIISNHANNLSENDIDKTQIEKELNNQTSENNFSIKDNKDGTFLVKSNKSQKEYYINNDGEIIDESNILKINTLDELKEFRNNVNLGNNYNGWYIYLTNNIQMDINETWEPIGLHRLRYGGEQNQPFSGTFDGNEYEIDYMKIDALSYNGLFGFVKNGTVKNLGIGAHCDMKECEGATHVGGVVGFLFNNSIIQNCYNLSDISGNTSKEVGGIVGSTNLNCEILNCYNKGNIKASTEENINTTTCVGGIVGNLINGKIENCYNGGTIQTSRRSRYCWKYIK